MHAQQTPWMQRALLHFFISLYCCYIKHLYMFNLSHLKVWTTIGLLYFEFCFIYNNHNYSVIYFT